MADKVVPNEHPFMGGADVDAWDCAVAPRLYLARQGCRALKVLPCSSLGGWGRRGVLLGGGRGARSAFTSPARQGCRALEVLGQGKGEDGLGGLGVEV